MSRQKATIVHVDLDAFFAAVEQRDKPSLRGKPVVVGGSGSRGVVSTASYEARAFGARSAMTMHEARRRCPAGTAYLGGRFKAYQISSAVVMDVLRDVSPALEQVSVDEAFLDLSSIDPGDPISAMPPDEVGALLAQRIHDATGGLSASVGIATSKMMAKIGSELGKPAGVSVIAPGTEREILEPMDVRAISGVGPATARTLRGFGIEKVTDLARVSKPDLISIFGNAQGESLHALARAEDPRVVATHRSAKSISAEETFEDDIADPTRLAEELDMLARRVSGRLGDSAGFARTITIKVRWHDFRTVTRSGSLPFATGDAAVIAREAARLLGSIDTSNGLRLLGVGVSGLTSHAQDELDLDDTQPGWMSTTPTLGFPDVGSAQSSAPRGQANDLAPALESPRANWSTGADIAHAEYGAGWVWGSGLGLVTVRFEGPLTAPGRVRSFRGDDPDLSVAEPPSWHIQAESAC